MNNYANSILFEQNNSITYGWEQSDLSFGLSRRGVLKLLCFDSKAKDRVSCRDFKISWLGREWVTTVPVSNNGTARRHRNERQNIHEARMRRQTTRKNSTRGVATALGDNVRRIERRMHLASTIRKCIYFFHIAFFPVRYRKVRCDNKCRETSLLTR